MTVSLNRPVVCPVLIGRTPDLALLQLSLEQVKSGKGQVALLCGEAGIGKSRLVAEIKTEAFAQDFQLLQGNCFPTDRSCPYAPLLDLLRSFFLASSTAQVEALVGPFAREFAPLFPDVVQAFHGLSVLPPLPSLDPEQEKRRLFAALAHFFLSQAAVQPLLLVVEDLHWSDDTSLEFLQYVVRRCATQPLLILLTYRSDEVHPTLSHWLAELDREHLGQEVTLTRLTRSETGAMLRAIRQALRSDGRYVCLDINCAEHLEGNAGPLGSLFYGFSVLYCMTTSLSGHGEGLGTVGLPEGKLRELSTEEGFSSVRRVPLENPFNILYEIQP